MNEEYYIEKQIISYEDQIDQLWDRVALLNSRLERETSEDEKRVIRETISKTEKRIGRINELIAELKYDRDHPFYRYN